MKQVLVVVSFGLLAFFQSCTKAVPKNIVCLVDLSLSRDSTVLSWYRTVIIDNIMNHLGPQDRLTILPIDGNSETASTELLSIDLSKYRYGNEFAGLQQKEIEAESLRDTIDREAARLDQSFNRAHNNRMQFRGGTDVLGAIRESIRYKASGYQNVLVIFSDMLQDGAGIHLEKDLQKSNVAAVLEAVEQVDLTNTTVIVLTGWQNIEPERFALIRSFWQQYFDRCSAASLEFSSGAVSTILRHFEKEK
jgi:hypothetical protein